MTTSHSKAPNNTPYFERRFSALSIAFHWGVGLLIIAVIAISFYMESLPPSSYKYQVYNLHKSLGLLVLLLAVPRLIWRLSHGRPPKLPHYKTWEVWLSGTVTWAMYALMIAMPLSGWLMNSAAGFPLKAFGTVPVPLLMDNNKELAELFEEAHELMGDALKILILLHVAGVLKHLTIDKDNTLYRMLPLHVLKRQHKDKKA